MRQLIYEPAKNKKMTTVCFVSGSGTNYERIVEMDPSKNYVVCSNRPNCEGVKKAYNNLHPVVTLDSDDYFKNVLGLDRIPRKGPERDGFDSTLCKSLESTTHGKPDLICLAGYDLWVGDWMIDNYYPRILNVHPGDMTKGYVGLHWMPSAQAILVGEDEIRSTVFIVDKGDDTGPVLVQSKPVPILQKEWERDLYEIRDFAAKENAKNIKDFRIAAENEEKIHLTKQLELISRDLQEILKREGDWEIYPFVVHELIANGRVELDGRAVYIDGKAMPEYGYRMDEHENH